MTHPSATYMAIVTTNGTLKLIDYESKTSLAVVQLGKSSPSAIAIDPMGRYISVGCSKGITSLPPPPKPCGVSEVDSKKQGG